MEAAFGSLGDTTNMAKAAAIFQSPLSGEEMVDLIDGMYRIRYAQGLGRRTEGKLSRSLIWNSVCSSASP